MKFSYWLRSEYAGDKDSRQWPTPGRLWDPATGAESSQRALRLADRAVAGGFDMVSVAEHHYGYSSLIPSPALMAMAVASRYPEIKVGILGPVLPLSNPVRVAEEIAMVDVVSGGRTIVGFFRGVAGESLVHGNNPEVTADMFREAFELIMHAWTEPETFGWEGRNYRFRTISTFPRPLQQPHPPIVQSASSIDSATRTGHDGYMVGIFAPAVGGRAAEIAAAYRDARAESGAPASPEDILYRARVYVADTDEQADADIDRYGIGNTQGWMTPAPARAAAAGKVRGALYSAATPARQPSQSHTGTNPGLRPDFAGSPETVIRQLRESNAQIGWGFLDGLFTWPAMPFALAERSVELFTTRVMPELAGSAVAAPGQAES